MVVVALALGLLAFSVVGTPARAAGAFGAFDATDGTIDAKTAATQTVATIADMPSGSTDDSYSGGGPKENDLCPTVDLNHAAPPKADITSFVYGTDSAVPGVLYLGWTRKSATGTLTVDFELNKSTTACSNHVNPVRSNGDVLVTYDFQGGTTIGIQVRTWNATTLAWELQGDVPSAHQQSINPDQSSGELAINLIDFHILDTSATAPCTTFASGWAKTRTGATGAFDTSTVKDFIKPAVTNVSNCGSITIVKDARPDSAQVFSFTSSTADIPNFTLFDDGSGVGNSTGTKQVHPGSFTIDEPTEPAGWNFDSVSCTGTGSRTITGTQIAVNLSPSDALVCTYVNTQPNTITIVKDASVKTSRSFPFTTAGTGLSNFGLVDNGVVGSTANSRSFSSLPAGNYSIIEGASQGWALSSITCSGAAVTFGNSPGHTPFAAGDTRVNITLTNGDVATCTYANTKTLPTIGVTKTASPTTVPEPGAAVAFAVHVTNTSPQPVTLTDLSDSVFGDVADATNPAIISTTCVTGGTLAATTGTYDCSFTATVAGNAGFVHNDVVTATAVDLDGSIATAHDDATVTVTDVLPQIHVTKSPSATTVHSGDSVTYTYAVTSTGSVEPLLNVTATDDKCSPVTYTGGDANANGKLDITESWTYTCTTALTATTTNIVTATGKDDDGNTATATAPASVSVIHPAIAVAKAASAATVHVGDSVTYTYKVTNPGDVPLSNVSVTDDKCSPVTAASPLGDTNGDGKLDAGETWTYTCTTTLSSTTTNVATASGVDPLGATVTKTGTATVTVIHPAIVVKKTPSQTSVNPGDTVVYTYVVTNTGDVSLTNVVVTDDKCSPVTFVGGDANGDGILQTTETWTFQCSQVQTGDANLLTNVATATGTELLGVKVTSNDKVTIAVVAPEVLVRAPELPRTGANIVGLLELAGSLFLLGFSLLGISWRRRTA